jgi:predicted nucleotidyltransferase
MMPISINKFGLSERDINTITSILKKFPEVEQINIFGSRALNTYKTGSDIDLAIINKNVSSKTLSQIQSEFSDSSLPYQVDLIDYTTLTHQELKNHIDRAGMVFYKKN